MWTQQHAFKTNTDHVFVFYCADFHCLSIYTRNLWPLCFPLVDRTCCLCSCVKKMWGESLERLCLSHWIIWDCEWKKKKKNLWMNVFWLRISDTVGVWFAWGEKIAGLFIFLLKSVNGHFHAFHKKRKMWLFFYKIFFTP